MSDAIRGVRIFSAIAVLSGIGACIAGTLTGDTVPVVLGVTAAACGVILAVFASLAHRKTRA
ncbi:hypothetical protein [Streptomyces indiaensis]|uniref:Lipoprotein n=1 Tax=Streptomyces indiaensis TaxID=284033 RepID=A0ABP5QM19_9ACTN|nr:hypothetical protein [Streptomyces indiaensis]MCF1644894.1 hypothetical protein [Streptomyces indiaensis]